MKDIIFNGKKLKLSWRIYVDSSPVIQLMNEEGLPPITASVFHPRLQPKEIGIKDYSENKGIYQALLDANIITKYHRILISGFENILVCKLTEEAMENFLETKKSTIQA